jgi:hypothetical protein
MNSGELHSFRCGRSRRITMASVKKLIARQIAITDRAPGRPAPIRRQAIKPEVAAAQKRRTRAEQPLVE